MNSYTSRLVTASHIICYDKSKVVVCVQKYMRVVFPNYFSFAIVQSQVHLRGLVRGSMYKLLAHKLPPLIPAQPPRQTTYLNHTLHQNLRQRKSQLTSKIRNNLQQTKPHTRIHIAHNISCWLNRIQQVNITKKSATSKYT